MFKYNKEVQCKFISKLNPVGGAEYTSDASFWYGFQTSYTGNGTPTLSWTSGTSSS